MKQARLETLDAQANDPSASQLKADQLEALSHLPTVTGVVAELTELLAAFKKIEQSENEILLSHHRKAQNDLRDAEIAKVAAVKEAEERGREEARAETKAVLAFLRFASHQREVHAALSVEGSAVEAVLVGVYQGGEKAFETALKLAEGAKETVSPDNTYTCTPPKSLLFFLFLMCLVEDVKEMVLRFEDPTRGQPAEEPSEQNINGHSEELATGSAEAAYQVPLSEIPNGTLPQETYENPVDYTTGGVTFFQTSELELESYTTGPDGAYTTTQGISFMQESELITSQPQEPVLQEPNDVSSSTQLPPIQTLTETAAIPSSNFTAAATGAETGPKGNPAAEQMLPKDPSLQGTQQSKTDWAAEEASPTMETPPTLPEKKKDEEWTTQSSKHFRHQSQQRGRGGGRGGPRGEGWRGGGRSGGYRGGRGGERGAGNGERRGSYRGERGRGRGDGGAPSAFAPSTSA